MKVQSNNLLGNRQNQIQDNLTLDRQRMSQIPLIDFKEYLEEEKEKTSELKDNHHECKKNLCSPQCQGLMKVFNI